MDSRSANFVFRESDYVKRDLQETQKASARVDFIKFMLTWVSVFVGESIGIFEFCIAKPVGFVAEIKTIIDFVVSKNVKSLILDFSNPKEGEGEEGEAVELPDSVYNLPSLVSLKLFACRFDPSRFVNPGSLKSLCFGSTQLKKIKSLLSSTPLLESLTIQNCRNVGLDSITGVNNRLTELVIENSEFSLEYSMLDLPSIQIFKYVGKVHFFDFDRVNRIMQEAYLDFGAEMEYDEEETGTLLAGLLYNLLSARKVTVCPFLIQLIHESDDPVKLQQPMESKHLVIKTNLDPNEFIGIRLMINSCPDLETLTFEMVERPIFTNSASRFDPDNYWTKIPHECLKKTLKFVEVKGFKGGMRVVQVMQYLLGFGRVLETVDLFIPEGLGEGETAVARHTGEMIGTRCRRGSNRVKVYLHEGEETREF